MVEQVWTKKCSCGLTHTEETWASLVSVGYQKWPWGEVHELKNCQCFTTLVRVLEEGSDSNESLTALPCR